MLLYLGNLIVWLVLILIGVGGLAGTYHGISIAIDETTGYYRYGKWYKDISYILRTASIWVVTTLLFLLGWSIVGIIVYSGVLLINFTSEGY